jgi:predicted transcriptional regulator/transcriptional regulator with XRE-family HTH domain
MNNNFEINMGPRLKKQRINRGFSQAKLSKSIGISPSYLNLIENGKRKIPISLLIKAADELDLSIKDFSAESNKRLLSDVMDVLSNEIFDDLKITNHDTSNFIGSNPNIAKALLSINDTFKSFKEDMQNRLETMDVNSGTINKPTRLPVEIVSDILQENKNYFHDLELSSEKLREEIGLEIGPNIRSVSKLTKFHETKHNVKVKIVTVSEDEKIVKRFDEKSKIFYLSEMLTYTSRNFHLASQVAYLEAKQIIEKVIQNNNIESEEVVPLFKLSLLNYYAAAFMMPYDDFLNSARQHKYDVEILMHHYACSFEQVTHRLTNLQRPGNEGVPFHFLKTDIAGNVSKRFSLSGIHIPRHGGSCPRWNVYTAFLNPGKIHPQISKMPDGRVYFCIARAFEKGVEKHGMPKSFVSIGLGCDMKYAKDLVYSEGIDLSNKKLQMPIGVSCRICPRVECQQRAFPPIDKELRLDINYRGTSPYVTI